MNPQPTTPPASSTDHALQLRCLQSVRAALAEQIIPDLKDAHALTAGHVALRVIERLVAAHGGALAAARPAPEEPGLQRAWAALGKPDDALADEYRLAQAAAAAILEKGDAARSFVRELGRAQKAELVRLDPAAARGVADMYLGGRKAADEEQGPATEIEKLSLESLTDYLRERFPDRAARRVLSLDELPGGMSKQTIRVRCEEHGREEQFILRKDLAINPADRSVVEEFPLLQFVWQTGGVPMAEPLWLESDPQRFGTPVMASSLVNGGNEVATWSADAAAKQRFTQSLAAALARLHSIAPPGAATQGAPEHVAREIGRWYADWKRWEIEPRPLMEAVFAWLRHNIPASRRAASLVHGDVGFHNMLSRDGEVTGLLDWEFAHVGDAAADLVYARPFIETVLDWPAFLAAYAGCGGIPPSAEEERFYAAWGSARNAAGCAGALSKFLHHPGADMRLAVSGMTFLARFELDAYERALG